VIGIDDDLRIGRVIMEVEKSEVVSSG